MIQSYFDSYKSSTDWPYIYMVFTTDELFEVIWSSCIYIYIFHVTAIALGEHAGFGQPVAELYTSAPSYSIIKKKSCMLCLHAKFEILTNRNKNELFNKRSELASKCCHVNKYLQSIYKANSLKYLWNNSII